MRNYQPDYRPIKDYMKGLEKNKAKAALVTAAKATKVDNIPIPRLELPRVQRQCPAGNDHRGAESPPRS